MSLACCLSIMEYVRCFAAHASVVSGGEMVLHCRVLFLGAWHGWHAALSFMVGQKATAVKRWLDPISSGMVIL